VEDGWHRAGTVLVKDIYPGTIGSLPRNWCVR
jgi:ELWxxDGT repeat protein